LRFAWLAPAKATARFSFVVGMDDLSEAVCSVWAPS